MQRVHAPPADERYYRWFATLAFCTALGVSYSLAVEASRTLVKLRAALRLTADEFIWLVEGVSYIVVVLGGGKLGSIGIGSLD